MSLEAFGVLVTAGATLVLAFMTWRSVKASERLIANEEAHRQREYSAALQAVYFELLGIAIPLQYLLTGNPVVIPKGFGAYQQMLDRLYTRLPVDLGQRLAKTYNMIELWGPSGPLLSLDTPTRSLWSTTRTYSAP